MLYLFAICLVGVGVYTFVNRDAVWRSQERANEWRGLASERSDGWEQMTSFRGALAIIMGIIIFLIAIVQTTSQISAPDATATANAFYQQALTSMAPFATNPPGPTVSPAATETPAE